MIRVTVELWPGGDESRKRTLGVGVIANEGTHPDHPRRGNYLFGFGKPGSRRVRSGRHENFPRRSRDAWELLRRCLNELEAK